MASGFSYSYTPRTSPYRYCSLKDVLNEKTQRLENEEALVHHRIDGSRDSLTYKDLNAKATQLAKYLVSMGITRGDRIALFGSNSMNLAISEIGIILAGAVVVHISIRSTDASDAIDIVQSANCRSFLLDPGKDDKLVEPVTNIIEFMKSRKDSDQHTESEFGTRNVLLLRENENFSNCHTFDSILKHNSESIKLPEIYPEDPAIVFSTSGSTGKPKMVLHTHFNVANIQLGFPLSEPEGEIRKVFNDRPFTWFGGSSLVCLSVMDSRVFMETAVGVKGQSTEYIWDIIKSEKCTYMVHVPFFLLDLINLKGKQDKSFKVKSILTGGQMIGKNHLQVIGNVCTDSLVCVYGSTEASIATSIIIKDAKQDVKLGDVGVPLLGIEVKTVNDDGHVTKVNQMGEICIRSNTIFRHYLNSSVDQEMKDGWFKSGDMGYIAENGHVFIKGRRSDVISRGTRKIIPASVEEVIMQMDGLQKAVVIPVPDERLLEEVCVCFVPKEGVDIGPEQVKEYCMQAFVTDKAVDGLGEMPKYFLKYEALPVLSTGKLDKTTLKADAKTKCLM